MHSGSRIGSETFWSLVLGWRRINRARMANKERRAMMVSKASKAWREWWANLEKQAKQDRPAKPERAERQDRLDFKVKQGQRESKVLLVRPVSTTTTSLLQNPPMIALRSATTEEPSP